MVQLKRTVVVVLVAAVLAGCSSDKRVTSPASNGGSGAGSTVLATSAPASEVSPPATAPKALPPVALPNSDDPLELTKQLYSNYENAFNYSLDTEYSKKCLDLYLYGTSGTYTESTFSRLNAMRAIKAQNPAYKMRYSPAKIIDSNFTPTERIIVLEEEERLGETTKHRTIRLTLSPKEVEVDNGKAIKDHANVWLISSRENVDPGAVTQSSG